jgi:hypothetical protein
VSSGEGQGGEKVWHLNGLLFAVYSFGVFSGGVVAGVILDILFNLSR